MNEVNKNTSPAISVIVPVYNAEKTLRQCVDNILAQECKDFELLLIDDGSKDGSPAICDECAEKDSRVRVFHKENGGVSSARNVGLDHAKGEWITFIDSDDYITGGYLEGVTDRKEDVIIKGYDCFTPTSTEISSAAEDMARIPVFVDLLNKYITGFMLRGPVFKFYKRSIIGDSRFLQDMKIGEDAYFVFNYLAKCKNFAVLLGGKYVVRLAESPAEVKYAISVDYAVQSLNHLKKAYEGLVQAHDIDRSHFLSYIGYFKRISQSDWLKDKARWYGNKNVKAFYDYVWSALSTKQKCRILVARFLKR